MSLDHQPLHGLKSHDAAQKGVALVPEDRRIIPGLTVQENLELTKRGVLPQFSMEHTCAGHGTQGECVH